MRKRTKSSYIKRLLPFGKFLYYTGVLKVQGEYGGWTSKVRALHPFSWIMVVISIIVLGINKGTFKEIKNDFVLW